jgi:hypothetical protein
MNNFVSLHNQIVRDTCRNTKLLYARDSAAVNDWHKIEFFPTELGHKNVFFLANQIVYDLRRDLSSAVSSAGLCGF